MKERIKKALENGKVTKDTFIDNEIKNNINSKEADAIVKILINTPVIENGGVTAITGFYYQFLISIQYLIEMYEGKWDYIGIELHDDIVAVKNNKVRFIQVKTSKYDWLLASKTTIYARSKEECMNINDNWVDKLLLKSKFFPKNEKYETEFNIVTSFRFEDTGTYKIPKCFRERDCNFDNDNKIIERLNEDVYYKDVDQYIKLNYSDMFGETLNELLLRVHIDEHVALRYIKQIESDILKELERVIFKDEHGISICDEHLKMLIGEICCLCNVNEDAIGLIIDRDQLNKLFEKIRQNALNIAETSMGRIANNKIIDEVFSDIHNEMKNYISYNEVKNQILYYHEYTKNWILCNGGIFSLFNRYCDGVSFSTSYADCSKIDIQGKIKNLFITIIILNFVYNNNLQFDTGSALLIKKIGYNDKTLNSFLSLKANDEVTDGIDRLKKIILDSELIEQLELSSKRLNVIFNDYYDEDFSESIIIEIPNRIIPEIKNEDKLLNEEPKMGEMSIFANIIPGKRLIYKSKKMLNSKEKQNVLSELRKELKQYDWKE